MDPPLPHHVGSVMVVYDATSLHLFQLMDLVNDLDHFKGKGEGNEVQVSIRICLFPLLHGPGAGAQRKVGRSTGLEAEVEFCSWLPGLVCHAVYQG